MSDHAWSCLVVCSAFIGLDRTAQRSHLILSDNEILFKVIFIKKKCYLGDIKKIFARPKISTVPGLARLPARESPRKTAASFLDGRREIDGAEGLWRIGNSLYNLETFAKSHPGGAEWLRLTKDTDITELFEVPQSNLTNYILFHFIVILQYFFLSLILSLHTHINVYLRNNM